MLSDVRETYNHTMGYKVRIGWEQSISEILMVEFEKRERDGK